MLIKLVVIVAYAGCAAVCLAASTTKDQECPDEEFYDHGTEHCEPCVMICDGAEIMGTVDECRTLCPATYKLLNDQHKKPESPPLSPSDSQSHPPSSPTDTTSDIPTLVGGIIGGVVIVAAVVVVAALIFQRTRQTRPRQGSYTPTGVREEGEEGVREEEGRMERVEVQGGGPPGGWLAGCDPRDWLMSGAVPAEETPSGRQGNHEIALLGSSQGSGFQESSSHRSTFTTTFTTTPIYKPSGSMTSTRV